MPRRNATEAPKAPQFFTVPAGTPARECQGCRATIYWIETEAGKRMPVSCDVEGGVRPQRVGGSLGGVERVPGIGVSHFTNCPMAGAFRRAR